MTTEATTFSEVMMEVICARLADAINAGNKDARFIWRAKLMGYAAAERRRNVKP